MTFELSPSAFTQLALCQALFLQSAQQLTKPVQSLCGLLSPHWLSKPDIHNQARLETLLSELEPVLTQAGVMAPNAPFFSNDPRHFPFYLIQKNLIDIKQQIAPVSAQISFNRYLDIALTVLQALMVIDASHKRQIYHVNALEHAEMLAKNAVAKAHALGEKVVVAVLDKSAQLVLLHRMDDSLLISTEIAQQKARSAILMRMPSGDLRELVKTDHSLSGLQYLTQPNLCILAGGFPLYADTRLVGALGVSGASLDIDAEIAQHAIQASYLHWQAH